MKPSAPEKYVDAKDRTQPNAKFDDYEIQDAMRTLRSANKIKKNKSLMRAVKKAAQEQLKFLSTQG